MVGRPPRQTLLAPGEGRPSGSCLAKPIEFRSLAIQRKEIIKNPDPKQTSAQQIEQTGEDLAQVKPVNTEPAQKGEHYPGNRVVERSGNEKPICLTIQTGNQKKIDQPANSQKSKCKKPDRSGDLLAEVKSMRSGEAKEPEDVTDRY